MKSCLHCVHAKWNRTEAGRLHPSGDGHCEKEVKLPPLPAAFYWIGRPHFGGGHINRCSELKEHCVYFTRETA